MAIVRWDPFREVAQLQDRLNRVMSDAYGRNGADEVGGRQPEHDGTHRRAPFEPFAPRLVNLSRRGEPGNGHTSRNPFARYR